MFGKTALLFLTVALVILLLGLPKSIQAQNASCTAYGPPSNMLPGSTEDVTVTVSNSGSSNIVWIKITVPSANFTINSHSISGWTVSQSSSQLTITGNSLNSSRSSTFGFSLTAANTTAASANWSILVSDNADGSQPNACSNTVSTSISTPAEANSISDIVISDISSSQAKITWTTNNSSDSVVLYGKTTDYGSTKSDSTLTTSHSQTLTGLDVNTTYHFNIQSTDSNSSTAESGDNTFATAVAGSTTTTTVTVTVTATPSPATDKTAPRVLITNFDFSKIYSGNVEIKGEAFDISGISKVEYSLDGSKTWQIVPNITGLGSTTLGFSLTPQITADGLHVFLFRATDKSGNVGLSEKNNLITDKTGPAIEVSTDLSKPFEKSPLVTGRTSDSSGVVKVEYSKDGGQNWLPVEILKANQVEFSFNPELTFDGNYDLKVRSTDSVGNPTQTGNLTLIIDRLPPKIGAEIYAVGPNVLLPQKFGQIVIPKGTTLTAIISLVGGPTAVSIDVLNAGTDPQSFTLDKNKGTGLWSQDFTFKKDGYYTLIAHSIDGAGNKVERRLSNIVVLPNGKVLSKEIPLAKADVSLWYFEPTIGDFTLWDGKPYKMENPQKTNELGEYSLLAPAGKYYLQISSSGSKTLKTNIFELSDWTPIVTDFSLIEKSSLKIGPFKISLPDFSLIKSEINIKTGDIQNNPESASFINTAVPAFQLGSLSDISLRGKPTIISFLNSYLPQTSPMLLALEKATQNLNINTAAIFTNESKSFIETLQKRGGYKVDMAADSDSSLTENFNLHNLPLNFFVSREGIITKIISGVITEEEIKTNLSQ